MLKNKLLIQMIKRVKLVAEFLTRKLETVLRNVIGIHVNGKNLKMSRM